MFLVLFIWAPHYEFAKKTTQGFLSEDDFASRKPLSNISSVESSLYSVGPRFIMIHKAHMYKYHGSGREN